MNKIASAAAALLLAASSAFAAGHTYQVTGPVVEDTADHITVMKGQEKWEIAKGADTKVTGDVKVGAKVTVEYTMSATSVSVKETKAAPKAAKKKTAK